MGSYSIEIGKGWKLFWCKVFETTNQGKAPPERLSEIT